MASPGREPGRAPAPPAAARWVRHSAPGTRRSTARRSAVVGTSTSGASCAVKSRTILPPHKQAPPISTMPSCRQQAQLATAYFNLRAADSLIDLSNARSSNTRRRYDIVNNQFKAGYSVTAGDVATADASVRTTEAQLAVARSQRAQYEHAIAVLIGRPPAELGDRAARSRRRHSENSDFRSFGFARKTSRHRRCGANHAGAERADRRRRSGLFPGHLTVEHARISRSHPAAVYRRAFGWIDRGKRHANSVQWRPDLGARSTRRARSIGKASPIIGRQC